MSLNISSSDINRINAAAGINPVQVSEDTFYVIKRSLYFADLSGGAFDPTVGPIVSLWDIGGLNQRVPVPEEIKALLPLVNWRNVELDDLRCTVFLKYPGMMLDLGAIAKGYAADEAVKIIKKSGLNRALIDLGGDVITFGDRPDRSPWRIGIQNPLKERGEALGFLQVIGKTVVTSGIYERFFEENGIHYHHIFSPSLSFGDNPGYPVQNELLSVSLITDISMDADALSTAIFVMGYDRGMRLLKSLPEVDAIFIFKDQSIVVTPGLDFRLLDTNFRIEFITTE